MNETTIPTVLERIAAYMGWQVSANGAHCIVKIDEEWRGRRDPLSDIRDAFLIVEKLRGEGWNFDVATVPGGQWLASLIKGRMYIVSDNSPSPAAAICAAVAAALASSGAAAGRAKGGAE